jgi:squalene-hopene/tetraprenyl-beta-curcumene cyclase
MSSWTRTILAPLALVQCHRPVAALPPEVGIGELFSRPGAEREPPPAARFQGRWVSWRNFFRLCDGVLKVAERMIPLRWRGRSIRAAERWLLDHFEGSDGVGAIFPPMIYTVMALKCLGYAEDSPEFRWAEKQLDDLVIEENDRVRLQPCVSPLWDTAIATIALAEFEQEEVRPALAKAVDWLLGREIREPGDWTVLQPHVKPGGWAFEYNNRFYPDLDDTAMVLLAFAKAGVLEDSRVAEAVARGTAFLKGLQSSDNGWAAFDKDVCNRVLEAVPFADHNAMLDPTCPDITARVVEAFAALGCRRDEPFLERAVQYVLNRQEPEGCWYGRWGVNYIYGAWQALVGLTAIGYDPRHPRIRRAVDWLISKQQTNGGWGESADSYADRAKMGVGPTTASQTAWAVMALVAVGEARSSACRRGVEYLIATQKSDGDWDEPWFTGTGFPKVFYLRYHLYRLYFPLMALARYRAALQSERGSDAANVVLPMPMRA